MRLFSGDDGVWDYGDFYVLTARPTKGSETVSSFGAA